MSTGEKLLNESERSELKLLQRQENTHRNKVYKFKLYHSRKFRVLRSTKISNIFDWKRLVLCYFPTKKQL